RLPLRIVLGAGGARLAVLWPRLKRRVVDEAAGEGEDRGRDEDGEDAAHDHDLQSAATRSMAEKAPLAPMTYAGTRAQDGARSLRAGGTSASAAATKASCPASTPRLKPSSANGRSPSGTRSARRPPAKPKPCRRPKANASSAGRRRASVGGALPAGRAISPA